MLLDFMNHLFLSGNKLRKLEYHLNSFFQSGKRKIVSIGGYYSNHLTALAWVTGQLKIPSVGIINGHQPGYLGSSLRFLIEHDMELNFVSKSEFKSKYEKMAVGQYPDTDSYFIPLGGRDISGMFGFERLISRINSLRYPEFDEWWICYGSGTSASAIAHYIEPHQTVFAQGAVADTFELLHLSESNGDIIKNVRSNPDIYFGGIGKYNENLITLIDSFRKYTGIPLDPIYTGKLVYYFQKYLEENLIDETKTYLLIHTGGLQGIEGFNELHKTRLSLESDPNKFEKLIVAEV